MTMSGTTNDNEWQRMTASGTNMTTSDNKWYNEWQRVVQRVTANDNNWHQMTTSDKEWQRVTTSDIQITNKNEWQRVKQRMQTNESEWNQVKENEFGFGMKLNMQCITTIYSAIQIIYKLGNWRHIFSI